MERAVDLNGLRGQPPDHRVIRAVRAVALAVKAYSLTISPLGVKETFMISENIASAVWRSDGRHHVPTIDSTRKSFSAHFYWRRLIRLCATNQ